MSASYPEKLCICLFALLNTAHSLVGGLCILRDIHHVANNPDRNLLPDRSSLDLHGVLRDLIRDHPAPIPADSCALELPI